MKENRNLWVGSWLFVLPLLFLLSGCGSDNEMNVPSGTFSGDELGVLQENGESAYTDLLSSLEAYSDAYLASYASPFAANRKWGWHRFWESVGADFGSASGGGVAISPSTSHGKWKELKLKEKVEHINATLDDPVKRRRVSHEIDSLKNVYQSNPNNYGAFHNAVILTSLLNTGLDYDTTEELAITTLNSMRSLGFSTTGETVTDLAREVDDFLLKVYDEDITIMYERLAKKYPSKTNDLKVMEKYMTNIKSLRTLNDVREYTEGYSNLVNSSKISFDAKTELYRCLSIAPASLELWMEVEELLSE